jgi:tRNA (guanine-N7-)-methyltransferase
MSTLTQKPSQLPRNVGGCNGGAVDPKVFCLAPTSLGERIDFSELFGNSRKVELDVGSGKGLFLLHEAQRRREINFLGFEWASKYARAAAERLARHGVGNVRIIVGDVRPVLPKLPAAAVGAVHVYFPDPWWKRRHRKRRLFNGEFVNQVARILAPAGQLHFATDVEEYFGVMLREVDRNAGFTRLESPQPSAPQHDLDYLTHFERKYRQQGRTILRAGYALAGAPAAAPSGPDMPATAEPFGR